MSELQTATVAGGCFWCTEAVFKQIEGVDSVTSGYAGGNVEDPSYEAVCSGDTGHAECVQVEYDPEVIDYDDVLTVFFATHNPTTKNRQGPDIGSQYRSAVFYHDEDQREAAETLVEDLGSQYSDPIVTEIEPLDIFYPAKEYHQDYYERNPGQGYCAVNIDPKLKKLNEQFRELLA
jgi:peptide-methionine (S)-S-oxide reductase